MSKILDDRSSDAGTHAFVIGVGKYRHLRDGEKPGDIDLGLGQLKSPPVSARLLADWLLKELYNPEAPLRSLELLLSPGGLYTNPKSGEERRVHPATMSNVKAAFRRWRWRCERNVDNVAVFYFCGHGIQKNFRTALLLEDVGSDPEAFFDNAIDFEGTHRGMMTRCRAGVQCFIADACRQVPYETLAEVETKATALLSAVEGKFYPRDAPSYYATAPVDPAYGDTDGATRYTQALLDSLRGLGSTEKAGRWLVFTGGLQAGILAAMERLQQHEDSPQEPQIGGKISGRGVLHVLESAPAVPMTITLDPFAAVRHAQLSLVRVADPSDQPEPRLEAGAWAFDEVFCDDYDGSTTFLKGDYRGGPWRVKPIPPHPELRWRVNAL